MFNKNFYPTPDEAIKLLVDGMDLRNKRILEPSAGKGNIVDFISKDMHNDRSWHDDRPAIKLDVLESEQELQSILQGKRCNLVGSDFLTFNTHMEYDVILMNPPFDEGDKHLLKALSLAERQTYNSCEIRCILNAQTIKNTNTKYRQVLATKLAQYDATIELHEGLFAAAERSTNVEVAIIRVQVDAMRSTHRTVDKIIADLETGQDLSLEETTQLSTYLAANELEERVEDIKLYIKLYHQHVSYLKKHYESMRQLQTYETCIEHRIDKLDRHSRPRTILDAGSNRDAETNFLRLRRDYWKLILGTREFTDMLTNKGRRDLEKKLYDASNLEITEENVILLLQSVIENKTDMLKETLVDMFMKLTSEHMNDFSRNVHYFNGWKTNDAFSVKPKVILSRYEVYGSYHSSSWSEYSNSWSYDSNLRDYMNDLIKALQLLTVEQIPTDFVDNEDGTFDNPYFFIKAHKKGTVHVTFKDLDLLDRFNVFCGQELQWLPTEQEIQEDSKASKYMSKSFSRMNEHQYNLLSDVRGGKQIDRNSKQELEQGELEME